MCARTRECAHEHAHTHSVPAHTHARTNTQNACAHAHTHSVPMCTHTHTRVFPQNKCKIYMFYILMKNVYYMYIHIHSSIYIQIIMKRAYSLNYSTVNFGRLYM